MEKISLVKELSSNAYPGRGIVIGKTPDGTKAVTAYFIMGRSENSRNRVFVKDGEGIRTQAFDPDKLVDPSLIIYAPVRVLGNKTIVTNGDQTDTIYELMDKQMTFEQALRTREFEPDAPNYTPRISGIMHIENGKYNYALSILKSNNGDPQSCNRYTFAYTNPTAGEGHFIHTYKCDGDPLFQVLRVSLNWWKLWMISMNIPIFCGQILMQIIKFHYLCVILILLQVNTNQESSINIVNYLSEII